MKNIKIINRDSIQRTLDFSCDLQNYTYSLNHRENKEYIVSSKKSYLPDDLKDLIEKSANSLNIYLSLKTINCNTA